MKKGTFTLGLMLSMLFLGSTIVSAAETIGANPRAVNGYYTNVDYSVSVKANPHFTGFTNFVKDYTHDNRFLNIPFTYLGWGTSAGFNVLSHLSSTVNLTSRPLSKYDLNYGIGNTSETGGFANDYGIAYEHYGNRVYQSPAYTGSALNDYSGIFAIQKRGTDLRNVFELKFNYKDGKDLVPVVKRIVEIGQWYTFTGKRFDPHSGDSIEVEENILKPTGNFRAEYLTVFDVKTSTNFTFGSSDAIYTYSDPVMEVFKDLNIISIRYEIWLTDEIGYTGQEYYDPPTMEKPENPRAITFDIEDGIKTALPMSWIGNTFYVSSYKNFTFTVTSDEDVIVTTNRNGEYDNDGVAKKSLGSNKYEITIKQIQKDINVKVVKESSTLSQAGDGTTGTEGPADNAVWAAGGNLYVNAATPGLLSIYTIDGKLVKTAFATGSYSIPMSKGTYFVTFNGTTYKVIL
jgi:hypothetical protein